MPSPIYFDRSYDKSGSLKSESSILGPPSLRRRIFVMKQTSLLPVTAGPATTVQHILMFDDHPDSLRIIFGPPANSRTDDDEGSSLREFILPGIAILVALIVMFSPLF